MAKILLVERGCGAVQRYSSPEQLNESIHKKIIKETANNKAIFNGEYILSGPMQRANALNHNKRIYPYDELFRESKRLNEMFNDGGYLAGELDHTDDDFVRWERVSHRILKLWWENSELHGLIKILGEKHDFAARAQAIIDEFGTIGTSSRALGDLIFENGANRVKNLEVITWDLVTEPSTYKAFLTRYNGNKAVNEQLNHWIQETLKPVVLR